MVVFSFLFFLRATIETKFIYISNQTEIWKKYTERNTALEFKKGEWGHFKSLFYSKQKNTINYT